MKEEVTLTELLDEAEKSLTCKLGRQVGWYLLKVKMDLHSHKLIQVSFALSRVQYIRIKMDSKRKVKEWLISHNGNGRFNSM